MELDQELNPEKIKEYEDKMKAHYESRLPFLRIQREYHVLLAEIYAARVNHLKAQSALVQFDQEQKAFSEKDKLEKNGSNKTGENDKT